MHNKPEVLILLSGGVDSMACIHFYINIGKLPCALFIDYGQPASSKELECAKLISKHYGIKLFTASWKPVIDKKPGYIQARNAFLLIAALMEKPKSVSSVAIGLHSGTSYSDCQLKFILKMQKIYDLYCHKRIHISCPFMDFKKGDIYSYCFKYNLPISLTHSCEAGSKPCGKCLSCKDRELLNACA
jgi:7-cyano-7-deazaguanine synthase